VNEADIRVSDSEEPAPHASAVCGLADAPARALQPAFVIPGGLTADDIPWELMPAVDTPHENDPLLDALLAVDAYRRLAQIAMDAYAGLLITYQWSRQDLQDESDRRQRAEDECRALRVHLLLEGAGA
jgi:hypothetical protein